jgi:small subunit ribosomal protein S3
MAIEKLFVKEGIKESEVEEYLRKKFDRAGYSRTIIERTPLGTRIIVFAHRPGLVIGRSGRRINELTEEIKEKFGFENPLIDVKEVEQPMLDAMIVAKKIAKALERGINFKKVCNFYLEKVMEAGAIGVAIRVAGKLAGSERSRFQKFRSGFVAYSGEYAEKLVDKGYAQAMLKPGIVGVQVKIMKESPKEFILEKEIEKKEESVGSIEDKGDKGDKT